MKIQGIRPEEAGIWPPPGFRVYRARDRVEITPKERKTPSPEDKMCPECGSTLRWDARKHQIRYKKHQN